jgi:hypothetical protein
MVTTIAAAAVCDRRKGWLSPEGAFHPSPGRKAWAAGTSHSGLSPERAHQKQSEWVIH